MVGEMPKQPPAERTHQEAGGERDRRVELLYDGVLRGEERRREMQRESGIGIEIIPFDEIADRTHEIALSRRPTSACEKSSVATATMHYPHRR